MSISTREIAETVIDELKGLADRLRKVGEVKHVCFDWPISDCILGREACRVKIESHLVGVERAIYWLELRKCTYQELDRFFEALDRKSASYPRRNKPEKPGALYVGRSDSVCTRLADHLTCSQSPKTYGLQMGRWASSLSGIITVHVLDCTGLDNDIVQALEDGTWRHLSPLAGKQGPRLIA